MCGYYAVRGRQAGEFLGVKIYVPTLRGANAKKNCKFIICAEEVFGVRPPVDEPTQIPTDSFRL